MLLTIAIEGFILARRAEGASPDTIRAYRWGLSKLTNFLGEIGADSVSPDDLKRYFIHLRTTDLSEASLQIAWRV